MDYNNAPVFDQKNKIQFSSFFGTTQVTPDWTTGDRTLAEDLIYFITRESMSGTIAGKSFIFPAGTFLWIPAGRRHHLQVAGKKPFSVWYFRWLPGRTKGKRKIVPVIVPSAWTLLPLVEQIVRLHGEKSPHREIELRALMTLLSVRSERLRDENAGRSVRLSEAQKARLDFFVQKNPGARPVPAELARECGLSPDYFSRIFRHTFGVSPKRWILEKRIHRARLLLQESPRKISDIAGLLGYEDTRLFSRQYKSVFGVSPGRME